MLIPFYYLQVKNVSQDEIQGKIGKIYIPDQKVIINKNMSNLFLQSIYMKADRIKNNEAFAMMGKPILLGPLALWYVECVRIHPKMVL